MKGVLMHGHHSERSAPNAPNDGQVSVAPHTKIRVRSLVHAARGCASHVSEAAIDVHRRHRIMLVAGGCAGVRCCRLGCLRPLLTKAIDHHGHKVWCGGSVYKSKNISPRTQVMWHTPSAARQSKEGGGGCA
jgi:hypothetical protein